MYFIWNFIHSLHKSFLVFFHLNHSNTRRNYSNVFQKNLKYCLVSGPPVRSIKLFNHLTDFNTRNWKSCTLTQKECGPLTLSMDFFSPQEILETSNFPQLYQLVLKNLTKHFFSVSTNKINKIPQHWGVWSFWRTLERPNSSKPLKSRQLAKPTCCDVSPLNPCPQIQI